MGCASRNDLISLLGDRASQCPLLTCCAPCTAGWLGRVPGWGGFNFQVACQDPALPAQQAVIALRARNRTSNHPLAAPSLHTCLRPPKAAPPPGGSSETARQDSLIP
eukprot:4375028-Prymnesium_polylepis.2